MYIELIPVQDLIDGLNIRLTDTAIPEIFFPIKDKMAAGLKKILALEKSLSNLIDKEKKFAYTYKLLEDLICNYYFNLFIIANKTKEKTTERNKAATYLHVIHTWMKNIKFLTLELPELKECPAEKTIIFGKTADGNLAASWYWQPSKQSQKKCGFGNHIAYSATLELAKDAINTIAQMKNPEIFLIKNDWDFDCKPQIDSPDAKEEKDTTIDIALKNFIQSLQNKIRKGLQNIDGALNERQISLIGNLTKNLLEIKADKVPYTSEDYCKTLFNIFDKLYTAYQKYLEEHKITLIFLLSCLQNFSTDFEIHFKKFTEVTKIVKALVNPYIHSVSDGIQTMNPSFPRIPPKVNFSEQDYLELTEALQKYCPAKQTAKPKTKLEVFQNTDTSENSASPPQRQKIHDKPQKSHFWQLGSSKPPPPESPSHITTSPTPALP